MRARRISRMLLLAFSLSALIACSFFSCSKDPVSPPVPPAADTTSHEILWQYALLGDGSHSGLYDVAVLNDTLAYAVGELYFQDSLGEWNVFPWNLLRWDGHSWHMEQASFQTQYGRATPPLRGVVAFSSSDLWVISAYPKHWDGQSWKDYDLRVLLGDDSLAVHTGWGSSSSNLYFGGPWGILVHYDGTRWQRLATGTRMEICDIYGARTSQGGYEVLAVAGDYLQSHERRILQVKGTTVTTLADSGITEALSGIWFVPGQQYYTVGSGIYQKNLLSDTRWRNGPHDITTYYTEAIRGTAANDIFVAGHYRTLLHYNGSTWRSYQNPQLLESGVFVRLAVRGRLIIVVGYTATKAITAIGRRL